VTTQVGVGFVKGSELHVGKENHRKYRLKLRVTAKKSKTTGSGSRGTILKCPLPANDLYSQNRGKYPDFCKVKETELQHELRI
jgi:hypothetical protein